MKVVIEKDIPAPTDSGRGRKDRWPLSEMEPGDSFLAPSEERRSIINSAHNFKKRHPGRRYAVRTVEGGVRCWRTE